MKMNPVLFMVAAVAFAGLAVFVLFTDGKEISEISPGGIPRFQTIGENRVLNIFRQNKISLGRTGQSRPAANATAAVAGTFRDKYCSN